MIIETKGAGTARYREVIHRVLVRTAARARPDKTAADASRVCDSSDRGGTSERVSEPLDQQTAPNNAPHAVSCGYNYLKCQYIPEDMVATKGFEPLTPGFEVLFGPY
jgi:hypothetical protein